MVLIKNVSIRFFIFLKLKYFITLMEYYKLIIEKHNEAKLFEVSHETYIYSTRKMAKDGMLYKTLFNLIKYINEYEVDIDDKDMAYFRLIDDVYYLRKTALHMINQTELDSLIMKYMRSENDIIQLSYHVETIKMNEEEKFDLLDRYYYKKS